MKILVAAMFVVATTVPAMTPTEDKPFGGLCIDPVNVKTYPCPLGHDQFCNFVRQWQAKMKVNYPDVDRSVPEIERRCRLERTL